MDPNLPFFITAFVSLFAIIDAIGGGAVFLAITPDRTPAERTKMARKTALFVFFLLTFFVFLGNLIFFYFGITIDAFRVAGGIILLKIAMDMIEARSPRSRHTPEEDQEGLAKDDVAYIPMAIPLLSGPGAISAVLVLSAQAPTPPLKGILLTAIALNALLTYLILRGATKVVSIFKETRMRIFSRILGLLLAAISIQFILTGIKNFFEGAG